MPTPLGSSLALTTPSALQTALNQAGTFLNLAKNGINNYINNTAPQYIPPSPPIGQPLATYNPYQAYLGTPGTNPQTYLTPQFNPYQAYSGTPGTNPITNVAVNVQPAPININIPDFTSTFLNQTLPQLIHTYLPSAVPALNLAQNVAAAIQPVLGPAIAPFTDSVKTLMNNFAANFTELKNSLDKVMSQSGLNATTQVQQYTDFAKTAIQQILTLSNQNAATFNEPITKALKDIQTNVSMQTYINQAVLNKLQEDKEVKESQQVTDLKTLAENALHSILKVLDDVLKFLSNPAKAFDTGIDNILGGLRHEVTNSINEQQHKLNDILTKLQSGKYKTWHDVIDDFTKAGGLGTFLQAVFNVAILLTLPTRAILAGSEPLAKELAHLANAEHSVNLLDAATYIVYLFRNPKQSVWVETQLHKLGLSDEQISALVNASTQIVAPQEIIAAQLRGFIDAKKASRLLSDSGYDDENAKIIEQLAQVIPPISDLIAMMVHDVFSPADRARYALDEGYPQQLTALAEKQGLSEYWAKNYWAGHWQYPSPGQVFEMLHRRNSEPALKGFSVEDVDDFLRLADFSPIWRPRLRAISYQPLGRIDIRRMYKAGGKDIDWLRRHYEADGYNDTDVKDLIDWTINTQLPEDESELTKIENKLQAVVENRYIAGAMSSTDATNILKYLNKSDLFIQKAIPLWDLIKSLSGLHNETQDLSVKLRNATIAARTKGNISNRQAKQLLLSTGMSENQADLNLHYADLQYTVNLKAKAQDTYQTQFAMHNIDENEFRNALAGYEFTKDEIDKAFLEAQLQQANKTKKPTEKQLETWYKDSVIDSLQLQEELRGLGLSQKYVDLIFRDITRAKEVQ